MNALKRFIKKYFTHFSYFYSHLRYRLFYTLVLSLVVAVLDGFGLAMFLPLLQVADGSKSVDGEAMGNLGFLVDFLNGAGIALTLFSILIVILVFFVLKGLARFAEGYLKVSVRQYFIKKLRFDNVNKLNDYNYKAFVKADAGKIQNTLTVEVARVAQAYQDYMSTVQAVVMILAYVFLAFLSNPEFALLVTAGGLLSNLAYRQIYKRTKAASKELTKDGHKFNGLLIQKVTFFKYLKATGLIQSFSLKLKEYINRIEETNRKMGYYGAILRAAREPLIILVVVVVVMIQVTYFSQSIGLIILALMFFYRSLTFVMLMQTTWNSFLNNSGALEHMTAFMKELSMGREKYGKEKITDFSSEIKLSEVSFSYDSQPVLKNVSLQIRKNETIALVGESGSGKTTLVNLVAGLMPVEEGGITIDGTPLREVHMPSWQRCLGYITQEPTIFGDTVFNNVTFWAEPTEANKASFWRALEKAAIADFVHALPQQENEFLGIGGIQVSGGQKQRLSIARELYKDIRVLIMDEATSSLDSETEQVIQENINMLKGKLTIIIIAHRLSTVKNADRIVYLNKGQIESTGDFESLKRSSRNFERMVEFQEFL